MASTSPEPRDKGDRSNVGVSSDKIQAKQVLSATTSSGPLVKESLIGLMPRKLLTTKRLLVLDVKALSSNLKKCKSKEEFCKITPKFEEVSVSYSDFRKALDEVTDIEFAAELSDSVADLFEECFNSHEICKQRHFYCLDDNCDQMTEVKVTDSVSQVSRDINSSTTKASSAARLIELECKLSALRAVRDLELAKAKVEAKAKAQEMEAEAKAQEAAIEAETKARFSIEEAKLKAELKLLELSERGSSVASKSVLRRVRLIKGLIKGSAIGAVPHISFSVNRNSRELYDGGITAVDVRPEVSMPFRSQNSKYQETKPYLTFEQDQTETKQRPFEKASPREIESTRFEDLPRHSKADSSICAEKIFKTYLDRQGRNEYVNLASEIGYDGNNIAFVFYESQVRRLMRESPCSERHLGILRASCVGQPRELVNLFCVGPDGRCFHAAWAVSKSAH